jgi:dTDP-4-dehydrorhamnose 3,5-epimerase
MIFTETKMKGAYQIDLELQRDERGFFARSFCQQKFEAHGLKKIVAQCNVSFNEKKGTLRGMHFQIPPKAEAKLVRCTRGAIYDVIIDLRPGSSSYCSWVAIELTSDNNRMLYIPEGFAHGFQTLENNTEVFYQMFEFYAPDLARGVRWDDPEFRIAWPLPHPIISEKDRAHPFYKKATR